MTRRDGPPSPAWLSHPPRKAAAMIAPLLSFDQDGVQHAWDSSSLKAGGKCPVYYDLKIRKAWQRPGGSVHLWFGGIYAGAFELFHKRRAAGDDRPTAIRTSVRWALIESWDHDRDDHGQRIPGTGAPRTFPTANTAKNRATLIRSIVWYLDHFQDEAYTTYLRLDGTPAVEASFRLPIDNGITLCGHLDRVVTDKEANLFIHDQKTTGGTIGTYYFKQFKPDDQFSLYTFAGKAIYNIPIKGVVVDAAQIAVGFTRFERSPILFTDGELNEWYDDAMMLIEELQHSSREEHFRHNRMACHEYGGCEFREVCSRPKSVRENFLAADFIQGERWDPLRQR